jgi:2-polyprenyl-3-methyl-5-hydroxy-6-metoxy-1,4-benzoquinol methylase
VTTFRAFAGELVARAPEQAARLKAFLAAADATYWDRAERCFAAVSSYLAERNVALSDLIASADKDTLEYMKRVLQFRRTGRYPDEGAQIAAREVYADTESMRVDMLKLALSQFLWPHHYRLYAFFIDCVRRSADGVRRYLEIGPGHGLFLAAAARELASARLTAIDISEGSLQVTSELLRHLNVGVPVELRRQDATTLAAGETYDFITAGELIEHLDDPAAFLRTLRALLAPGGRAFITTCANCPDRTHVYRFNSVDEIRAMLAATGYEIELECVAPSADLPVAELERQRFSISYAALVSSAT